MIRIVCLLDKKNGVVTELFADAKHAVIMDAETGKCLGEFSRGQATEEDFARRIAAEDPEAVITGEIEKAPFEVLAEEAWITRYYGAGLKAGEALRLMNAYKLRLIPDYIGGTGCHSGGECHDHEH